eukprot:SAG11_NODE_17719_length_510_cov_4.464720_1_plen_100_part_00
MLNLYGTTKYRTVLIILNLYGTTKYRTTKYRTKLLYCTNTCLIDTGVLNLETEQIYITGFPVSTFIFRSTFTAQHNNNNNNNNNRTCENRNPGSAKTEI